MSAVCARVIGPRSVRGGRVVEANAMVEDVARDSIKCLALFGGAGAQPRERPTDTAPGLRGNPVTRSHRFVCKPFATSVHTLPPGTGISLVREGTIVATHQITGATKIHPHRHITTICNSTYSWTVSQARAAITNGDTFYVVLIDIHGEPVDRSASEHREMDLPCAMWRPHASYEPGRGQGQQPRQPACLFLDAVGARRHAKGGKPQDPASLTNDRLSPRDVCTRFLSRLEPRRPC